VKPASPWPQGRRAAVCLTYDDALPVHWREVAPSLEAKGLRATFYTPISPGFRSDLESWRKVAAAGHELGNHTVFHPCRSRDRFTWLDPSHDLRTFSETRFRQEIELANWILASVDGQSERTYGNTCFDREIGEGEGRQPVEPILRDGVAGARGEARTGLTVDPDLADLYNLGTTDGDGWTAENLIGLAEDARMRGHGLIYTFHGVGAGHHTMFVEAMAHAALVDWLADHRDEVWSGPLIGLVRHLRSRGFAPPAPGDGSGGPADLGDR